MFKIDFVVLFLPAAVDKGVGGETLEAARVRFFPVTGPSAIVDFVNP